MRDERAPDPPDDPIWTSILAETAHDFYHLPAYTQLAAVHERGEPQALLVEAGARRLLLPLVVRQIPGSDQDATSAYGHPGPVVTGTLDAGFLSEALAAGVDHLRDEGFVSLFVRLHPILNEEPPRGVGTLIRHGDTVAMDLSLSPEELWSQTRRNHRQQNSAGARRGICRARGPGVGTDRGLQVGVPRHDAASRSERLLPLR